jgi:hypothetical protein
LSLDGGTVQVRSDDLAQGGASKRFEFPLALGGDLANMQSFVYGDRLYMRLYNEERSVAIVDLSAGKVAYEGKIIVDGTAEQQKKRLSALTVFDFYLAR